MGLFHWLILASCTKGSSVTKGRLYGVSVGPGDPELLTLRAARILSEVDCVAAPDIGGSARAALHIIEDHIAGKELVDCSSPMTNDQRKTAEAYDAVADKLSALLDAGKSIAFVTLGDASVYSTWSYVNERMIARGYDVEVVPGVTSFCAAAAALREPLCERSEQLLVSPVSTGDVDAALDVYGTKVFMKSGKRLGELRDTLRGRGIADRAMVVANCGLEGQEIVPNLDEADSLPDGMSITIVKGDKQVVKPADTKALEDPYIKELQERVAPPDDGAHQAAYEKWNNVAKPIASLGVLEDDVMRIAALVGTADVALKKRIVVVFCADNGVVAQGVSQSGPEVTTAVAVNIAKGVSSVCMMAHAVGVEALAVDMGMLEPADVDGVIDRVISRGTGDISCGPAMTREDALKAIRAGVDLVGDLKDQGYDIICSGEMSIGNTTTSSAMSAAFLGLPVEALTGRGAGLSDAGLQRKIAAIKRALEVNDPDPTDALDVLAKLGGFDIAGMVGLFIGGAVHRVPIVIDGYISALAAYTAQRIMPGCECAMLASHVSAEPAAKFLLKELGVKPAIKAGMRLGEGTGAVCLVPMLDAALALYDGTTFSATGIDNYEVDLR